MFLFLVYVANFKENQPFLPFYLIIFVSRFDQIFVLPFCYDLLHQLAVSGHFSAKFFCQDNACLSR